MAKRKGLQFGSVEEFTKEYQPERMGATSFKQIVEQLRSHNVANVKPAAASVTPEKITTDIKEELKEKDKAKADDKRTDKLIESNRKLLTNIEKLTLAINASAIGAKGKLTAGGRGEELAKEQKIDYRTIGQRIKDKVMGRGGNAFDPNSLRYKFGTLRGLATTTGLVTRGSGGIIDSMLARREERKQGASTLMKLNPQMQNLSQFGGSEDLARGYFESKVAESQLSKRKLQNEQAKLEGLRASGMSDEEIARTTGGGRQIRARNLAAAELINVDPRLKGEKLAATNQTLFAGPDADKFNVSEEEENQLEAIQASSEPVKELVTITREENERKAKSDKELLDAIKGIQSSGGVLGGLMSALPSMGSMGGMGKAGGYLSKVGGLGKLAKGVGIGGLAALAGEGIQYGGDKLKEAGYEKTGKAVGTAGTATKYAGYGAMIGSVIPGVGTAIGAGIGGAIGLGKGIYDQYYSAPDKPQISSKETHNMHVEGMGTNNPKYIIDGQEVDPDTYTRISNMETGPAQIEAMKKASADAVANKSSENAIAKLPDNKQSSNTIVNAPTTVSKQTQNNNMKVPVRSEEPSVKSYYRSRFAT